MKEQRVQLQPVNSVAAEAGILQSSVSEIVKMQPVVSTESTKAARLMQFVKIAEPVTAKIVENKYQEQNTLDTIEYTTNAKNAASSIIEQSVDITDETERIKFLQDGMDKYLKNIREQKSISSAGLQAGLQTISTRLGAEQDKILTNKIENKVEDIENKFYTTAQEMIMQGKSPQDVLDFIKINGNKSYKEAGLMYVQAISSHLIESMQEDIASGKLKSQDYYKAQSQQLLHIKTKDGTVFSTHPTYGSIIDNFDNMIAKAYTDGKSGQKNVVFASLYNSFSTAPKGDMKSYVANMSILQKQADTGVISASNYKTLHTLIKSAYNGDEITDSKTTIEQMTTDLIDNPSIKLSQITPEYFRQRGINNPQNQDYIFNKVKATREADTDVSKNHRSIFRAYSAPTSDGMPASHSKIETEEAVRYYNDLITDQHMRPRDAFNLTLKEFGMDPVQPKGHNKMTEIKVSGVDTNKTNTAFQNKSTELKSYINRFGSRSALKDIVGNTSNK
jgi:hypothetical protein